MQCNTTASRPFATEIYSVIKNGRITTPFDKEVTARQLCGKAFWDKLTTGQRRFAGRFISAAVRTGFFGLEQVHRDSANAWRYRRERTERPATPTLH